MAPLLFILLYLFVPNLGSAATQNPPLVGTWQYDGFFYEGIRYPNPNPSLILTFSFLGNGISHLYWHRVGEEGFCERRADYWLEGHLLHQKVTWINPKNHRDCAKDPDMQPNHETETRFVIQGAELNFFFDLNGKEFLYILKRTLPPPVTDDI